MPKIRAFKLRFCGACMCHLRIDSRRCPIAVSFCFSWPVRRRVEFQTASLVYQVMSSKVPTYDIHLTSESFARSLRSSSGRKCSVTRVHSRFGDRCFAAAGPRIWNNLPASLRDCHGIGVRAYCLEETRRIK